MGVGLGTVVGVGVAVLVALGLGLDVVVGTGAVVSSGMDAPASAVACEGLNGAKTRAAETTRATETAG
jgi:carbonic anhydrase/acetyltransferase-like protein (isoleucine patch superfamily)